MLYSFASITVKPIRPAWYEYNLGIVKTLFNIAMTVWPAIN